MDPLVVKELFSTDNIFISFLAIATLATALLYFIEYYYQKINNSIITYEELIVSNETLSKYYIDNLEIVKTVFRALERNRRPNVNVAAVTIDILYFIIFTILGLIINWFGRLMLIACINEHNIITIYSIILIISLIIIIILIGHRILKIFFPFRLMSQDLSNLLKLLDNLTGLYYRNDLAKRVSDLGGGGSDNKSGDA